MTSPQSVPTDSSPTRPATARGRALITGAGPAGLTAAYELQRETAVEPVLFEMEEIVGGISRTVEYKGNRIDIGGHRFFSKSDRVMRWWLEMMPLETTADDSIELTYQGKQTDLDAPTNRADPEHEDTVMLVRSRQSRIYFLRKFFDYPISLSVKTLSNLGLVRSIKIGLSYMAVRIKPIRAPKNLEEFFISRFGRVLYGTFFKDYTEKVWGTECNQISAEWGAQRIKGLSITGAILHGLKQLLPKRSSQDIAQKGTETSLIERFMYPKLGPGQLWQEVQRRVTEAGGEVRLRKRVERFVVDRDSDTPRIKAVQVRDLETDQVTEEQGDYFFSTMPIQDLVRALDCDVPGSIKEISEGLVYRDFFTVGLLCDRLAVTERYNGKDQLLRDNWIYIQEPEVKIGRLQIFNNWSPWLVSDPNKVWIGLEYFCEEGDELWSMEDGALGAFGAKELASIGIVNEQDVRDTFVLRVPKTYPAYFGTYDRFGELRSYLDEFENLFLIGRNGMHKYNNQDHSMLTAMAAVENIRDGRTDKSNLWDVNTEQDYHEDAEERASA